MIICKPDGVYHVSHDNTTVKIENVIEYSVNVKTGEIPEIKIKIVEPNPEASLMIFPNAEVKAVKIDPENNGFFKILEDIKQCLDDTVRNGEDEDVPEGIRFIKMSDTAAKQISKSLGDMLHKLMNANSPDPATITADEDES